MPLRSGLACEIQASSALGTQSRMAFSYEPPPDNRYPEISYSLT